MQDRPHQPVANRSIADAALAPSGAARPTMVVPGLTVQTARTVIELFREARALQEFLKARVALAAQGLEHPIDHRALRDERHNPDLTHTVGTGRASRT